MDHELSISTGEWHKCRRYWNRGRICPFHPQMTDDDGDDQEEDETPPHSTGARQPLPLKPPTQTEPVKERQPTPLKQPDRIPVVFPNPFIKQPPPPGPGGPSRRPPIAVPDPLPPLPIPPILPPPLIPGVPIPAPIRPRVPEVPVPAGSLPDPDPGPVKLPDGFPVLGISRDRRGFDFDEPDFEEADPLTPATALQLVNSITRLFNQEFKTKGGLYLPALPNVSTKRGGSIDASSLSGLNSTYQDALTLAETAFTRSMPSPTRGLSGPIDVPASRSLFSRKKAGEIAAITAASGIGIKAFQMMSQGTGGRGGFTGRGALRRLETGFGF